MFPLTDAELQAVIVALKYWRRHREATGSRRGDQALTPEAVDTLIAKLELGMAVRPSPDQGSNLFHH
jgi:hypothetical protein